jgi:hypothetical protein
MPLDAWIALATVIAVFVPTGTTWLGADIIR